MFVNVPRRPPERELEIVFSFLFIPYYFLSLFTIYSFSFFLPPPASSHHHSPSSFFKMLLFKHFSQIPLFILFLSHSYLSSPYSSVFLLMFLIEFTFLIIPTNATLFFPCLLIPYHSCSFFPCHRFPHFSPKSAFLHICPLFLFVLPCSCQKVFFSFLLFTAQSF